MLQQWKQRAKSLLACNSSFSCLPLLHPSPIIVSFLLSQKGVSLLQFVLFLSQLFLSSLSLQYQPFEHFRTRWFLSRTYFEVVNHILCCFLQVKEDQIHPCILARWYSIHIVKKQPFALAYPILLHQLIQHQLEVVLNFVIAVMPQLLPLQLGVLEQGLKKLLLGLLH